MINLENHAAFYTMLFIFNWNVFIIWLWFSRKSSVSDELEFLDFSRPLDEVTLCRLPTTDKSWDSGKICTTNRQISVMFQVFIITMVKLIKPDLNTLYRKHDYVSWHLNRLQKKLELPKTFLGSATFISIFSRFYHNFNICGYKTKWNPWKWHKKCVFRDNLDRFHVAFTK